MKKTFQFLALILIQCIISTNLSAQASLSIQGILKKSNGVAVEDGPQDITFKLWDVATGGTTPLWFETQFGVEVFSGVYSAILGEPGKPLDISFNQQYYLGVSIGSVEMTPRIRLSSAPYALSIIGVSNEFPSAGTVKVDTLVVAKGVTVKQGVPGGIGTTGYGFNGDVNTGIYNPVNDEVGIYSNGNKIVKVDQNAVTVAGALNTSGTIATTGGDITTNQDVNAVNLNLTGGSIDYNGIKGWRLVDVDDFSSSADQWEVYKNTTSGTWSWENSSSSGAASTEDYGGYGGKGIGNQLPNDVVKKQFIVSGVYSEIKVKFKYFFIDQWQFHSQDKAWAAFSKTAGGSGIRVGWSKQGAMLMHTNTYFDQPDFKAAHHFTGLSNLTDHWEQGEMTASRIGSDTSFWVFIGGNRNYGVGSVEIWVR